MPGSCIWSSSFINLSMCLGDLSISMHRTEVPKFSWVFDLEFHPNFLHHAPRPNETVQFIKYSGLNSKHLCPNI